MKRNLIIFVTGNIISPGGGLKRQDLATIKRVGLFFKTQLLSHPQVRNLDWILCAVDPVTNAIAYLSWRRLINFNFFCQNFSTIP